MSTIRILFSTTVLSIVMLACGGGSTGPAGTSSSSTPPHEAPSILGLSVSPVRISAGDVALINCKFTGTKATLRPGMEFLTANGDFSVSPSTTTTYTIEVSGNGPAVSQSVTVEVIVPTTIQAGDMLTPRYRHTATTLSNGLVLITGGLRDRSPNDEALDSAELFDPSTGVFSAAGSMASARFGHTATLLNDGRVLIVGQDRRNYGESGNLGHGPTSEIFEPSTGTFHPTTTEPFGVRFEHTATKMRDGRVFITKGLQDLGISTLFMSFTYRWIQFSEIFTPETGQWVRVGRDTEMISSRGVSAILPNGLILHCAGMGTTAASEQAEVYDPVANISTQLPGRLVSARMTRAIANLPNGKVIIAGGTGKNGPLSSTEIFDPVSMTFSAGPSLPLAWSNPAAAVRPDGSVVFIQSQGPDGTSGIRDNTALLSGNSINDWQQTRHDREDAAIVTLKNGQILVTGGRQNSRALRSAEILRD